MGGNNRSSIMECITKNETNVRDRGAFCSSVFFIFKSAQMLHAVVYRRTYGIAVLVSQTWVSELVNVKCFVAHGF